ncbi:hypothetical protein [Pseudonocardia abyssalis]|uniref:J domain-containing protein n=1 Tax=Pseudonocardia abyssalis TaxID=2792008 RepID=A0ABS6UMQ2_9PSEU|nr:hypothetical protein [Pseudonocardia abyssalis]MBW0118439.1 hypothetical protein [Pseudonocardia abyssalis]MBW0133509.1 hypothetical protein [Pseudonocardia abyssalis]
MSPEQRAEYRAFVRDHHPDRGGDPEFFVAGLARLRAGRAAVPPGDDDRRYDAPIEIVTPLPLPARVVVALIRTLRWHRERRVE